MKNVRTTTSMLLLVAATAGFATGAGAQEGRTLPDADEILPATVGRNGSDVGPEQFGTGWSIKIIPGSQFVGMDSTDVSESTGGYFVASSGSKFAAPLDLPSGTEVAQVCVFAYDSTGSAELGVNWRVYGMSDGTGDPSVSSPYTATTGVAAVPNYTLLCVGPGTTVPRLISAYSDMNYDGSPEYNWHNVILTVPVNSAISWGGAYVQWRRAMSPAPTTATYPNDVPTTHPFFRFIEALGASGITAGCGAGSYCPDNQLTRGEMAVFLTKALGLYWPQ